MVSTHSRALRLVPSLVLATVAGLSGCGGENHAAVIGKVYEVKGKVVLKDGKPLPGGHIYFVRTDGALSSEGQIGADGMFSLSTGVAGEGTPPGDYKVRIEPADASVLATKRNGRANRLPYDRKYLDEDTSDLKVTIKAESNQLEPLRLR